jgi:hypothetical protein
LIPISLSLFSASGVAAPSGVAGVFNDGSRASWVWAASTASLLAVATPPTLPFSGDFEYWDGEDLVPDLALDFLEGGFTKRETYQIYKGTYTNILNGE